MANRIAQHGVLRPRSRKNYRLDVLLILMLTVLLLVFFGLSAGAS
jgi:hypothetical protein